MTVGFVVAKQLLLLNTTPELQFHYGGLDIYLLIGALPFISSLQDFFIVAHHVGTMGSAHAKTFHHIQNADVLGSTMMYGVMDHNQIRTLPL
tara:strand:- start:123 stop:398 length:276 start_codon:yes stop_codon:yes gene_type:complete